MVTSRGLASALKSTLLLAGRYVFVTAIGQTSDVLGIKDG